TQALPARAISTEIAGRLIRNLVAARSRGNLTRVKRLASFSTPESENYARQGEITARVAAFQAVVVRSPSGGARGRPNRHNQRRRPPVTRAANALGQSGTK